MLKNLKFLSLEIGGENDFSEKSAQNLGMAL